MLDSTTHERIIVFTEGNAGPYIMVPLDQLEAVKAMLHDNQVPFWVDADAISLDGKPEVTVVNLGRGANAAQVQRLLDTAK